MAAILTYPLAIAMFFLRKPIKRLEMTKSLSFEYAPNKCESNRGYGLWAFELFGACSLHRFCSLNILFG